MAAITKPRVFVSSTIKDFSDLRGALRHWLESAGYDVQLSEYNDFSRKPSSRTFAACFENIRQSDFFILLIGEERGSWYDQLERVSVTRQEFRVAREVAEAGHLQLLLFVREKVMAGLAQWQADGAPVQTNRTKRGLADPRFIEEFIAEVGRTTGADGSLWLSRFGEFRDVIAALRGPLALDLDLDKRLIRENLLEELLSNLSMLVFKRGNGVALRLASLTGQGRDAITIDRKQKTMYLTKEQLEGIGFMGVYRSPRFLNSNGLESAITAGIFREVDPRTHEIMSTTAHEALIDLLSDIENLRFHLQDPDYKAAEMNFFRKSIELSQQTMDEPVAIDALSVTRALIVHDRFDDVYRASLALARWLLDRRSSPLIERNPLVPIDGQSEAIVAERVSAQEIRQLIRQDVFPFGSQRDARDAELWADVDARLMLEMKERVRSWIDRLGVDIDDKEVDSIAIKVLEKVQAEALIDPSARVSL